MFFSLKMEMVKRLPKSANSICPNIYFLRLKWNLKVKLFVLLYLFFIKCPSIFGIFRHFYATWPSYKLAYIVVICNNSNCSGKKTTDGRNVERKEGTVGLLSSDCYLNDQTFQLIKMVTCSFVKYRTNKLVS